MRIKFDFIIKIGKKVWGAVDFQNVTNRLGGRSYTLIMFFAITAFWLALHSKLTADYAAVITALSGFHVARTIASDHYGDDDNNGNGNGAAPPPPPAAPGN